MRRANAQVASVRSRPMTAIATLVSVQKSYGKS